MNSPAKAHEPSMEEILASIRRIIADDDSAGAASPDAAGPLGAAARDAGDEPDDVLELTDPVSLPGEPSDVEFRDPEPSPVRAVAAEPPPAAAAEPVPLHPARAAPERLLSAAADSATSSAFAALAHTVLAENSRTLEDLVHEMLRPMLKTWLDDNLPALVERLVRQEIERVSRGGRR